MSQSLLASALLLFTSGIAVAQTQQPITLGRASEQRVAISSASQAARIGNAVMLRLHIFNAEQKLGSSARLLVSCDGSWISTTFRDVFQFDDDMTATEQERNAEAREDALDPYAIEQFSISTSKIAFADQIARRAPQYCKAAGREPKNSFIPVSRSAEEDGVLMTTSLVTGTAAKVDGAIDVWMRSTEYRREPMLNPDGTPLIISGRAQKSINATGKYTMQRVAFDCKQRRIGTYERSVYEVGKVTPEVDSVPRERLRLSAVTPGTVGESQLDWVCAIYASSSN